MEFELNRKEFDPMWASFKNGNRKAFEVIYRENAKSLISYGYKITSNKAVVEDSIQDLFFELWESRERIANTTSVKFYLFKALRYKVCRNLSKIDFENLQDISGLENELWLHSHESALINFELEMRQHNALKTQLDLLPSRQQEAINLRYFNDFSNEEVAQIMDLNYQSACNLIYSALRKLKLYLKEPFFN
ncbi:MAG TPA: sigma-70 family RNA polymerase sigma factor [Cyclobacteriaceae bacterium]